jgi:hypothetical protein
MLRCVRLRDEKVAYCLPGTDGAKHLRSYGELDRKGWEQLITNGTNCSATQTFKGEGSSK